MPSLQASKQNPVMGALAAALRAGKGALNYPGKLPNDVPLLGGMGAGDIVFGQGPELVEDMSYGSPPYRGKGWATQVDPRTVDLAFAPGVGAAATLATKVPRAAVKALRAAPTESTGRRDFMKKAAGLTAGAMTPDLLVRALRESAPQAVVQAVKAWTPELLHSAAKHSVNIPYGFSPDVMKLTPELEDLIKARYASPDEVAREQKLMEHWTEGPAGPSKVQLSEVPEAMGEIKAHPAYDPENDLTYGLPWQKINELEAKYQPIDTSRQQWNDAVDYLMDSYPPDQLDQFVRSGTRPPEWASKGLTDEHLAYARFPVRGPGSTGYPEDALNEALYPLLNGD